MQDSGIELPEGQTSEVPLCVDLDGTLICTDILWELVVKTLRKPSLAVRAFGVLLRGGKAALKSYLATHIDLDATALPYRESVLEFARQQSAVGRMVVLATATHISVARRIAEHLGIFSVVLGTEDDINLSGEAKRSRLVADFGGSGYDYIGDSMKDLPVFSSARQAHLVNPSKALHSAAASHGNVGTVFSDSRVGIPVLGRALRMHQWAKNLLLAVPLVAAHRLFDLGAMSNLAIAFLAFGCVASATYLINDLLDLEADRRHPKKHLRPLASGKLSIPRGILVAGVLGVAGLAVSIAFLPVEFGIYLGGYTALTLLYSTILKRLLLVDVLTLAVLYTMRILAGGAAVMVVVSEWLLMFSLFIFLSLAFLKRVIELAGKQGDERLAGRGYSPIDGEIMRSFGASSGLLAVLVLALYISSPAVAILYRSPKLLWLLCPLLIYWIARIWFLAARNEVDHDPVVFALYDWRSYVVAACGLVILVLASLRLDTIHFPT